MSTQHGRTMYEPLSFIRNLHICKLDCMQIYDPTFPRLEESNINRTINLLQHKIINQFQRTIILLDEDKNNQPILKNHRTS